MEGKSEKELDISLPPGQLGSDKPQLFRLLVSLGKGFVKKDEMTQHYFKVFPFPLLLLEA